MAVSPLCQVKDGSGAFNATINGVNVTPSNTITLRLADTTDVTEWYLIVLGTDETTSAPSLSGVNSTTNKVTAPSTQVTFPMVSGPGRAILFESTVLGPGGPQVTTFAVFTLTSTGTRVGAAGEQREGDGSFGWASKLNPVLRSGAPLLRYDDTTALPSLGVSTVQQAIDALKGVTSNFTAAGDLSGTSSSQTVVALRGRALSNATPVTNDVITFNGTSWVYAQAASGFTAGGDLDGTSTEQTLVKIQGIALYASSPNLGDTLVYDGNTWGTSPGGGGSSGTASGDLSGTYPSPLVVKLRGKALDTSVGSPNANDLLYFSSLDNAYKAGSPSLGGDLSGTLGAAQVSKWVGKTLASGYANPTHGQMPTYSTYTGGTWNLTLAPSAAGQFYWWNTGATPHAWALSNAPMSSGISPVWNGSIWTTGRTDAEKIQGFDVQRVLPNDQDLLTWDDANSRWYPQALSFIAVKTAFIAADSSVDFNLQQLTNVADPTTPQGVATKAYVDALAQGLDAKASCRVATTATITLSGLQTIDGVSLQAGDRVLVKNQSTAADNGIYLVQVGAWVRAQDADTSSKVTSGLFTFIEAGTTHADSGWVLITDGTIVLGTTPLSFTQFSGAGQLVAGNGLTKAGNTLSVLPADASIVVNGSGVSLGTVSFAKVIAGLGTAAPAAAGQLLVSSSTSAFTLIAAPSSANTFLGWNGSAFTWATPTFTEAQLRTAAAGLTAALNVNTREVTNAGNPTAAQSLVTRSFMELYVAKTVSMDLSAQSGTYNPPANLFDASIIILGGSPLGDIIVQFPYAQGRRWTVINGTFTPPRLVQVQSDSVGQRPITLLPGQMRDVFFDVIGALRAADEKTLIMETSIGGGGAAGTLDTLLCKLPPRAVLRSVDIAGVTDRTAGGATTSIQIETSPGAQDIIKQLTFPGSGVVLGEVYGDWGSAMLNGSSYSAAARTLTARNIISGGTVTGSPTANITIVAVVL